jgi:transposase InsO family protein
MPRDGRTPGRVKWAQFKHSVVGGLFASPPPKGALRAALEELAQTTWIHPITREPCTFAYATIESWYYQARGQHDPIGALARKVRADSGTVRAMSQKLRDALTRQYDEHPGWTYILHYANLQILVEREASLGRLPSYRTMRRYMKATGMRRRTRKGRAGSPGARKAEWRFQHREVRGYEVEYVNALWHYDFHHSSVRVLLSSGEWAYPVLCGVIDDRSRLCCHAQWYLAETAESLVSTLIQAYLKRGLPRADLSDNGAPMIAHETVEGLERLGILHQTTLPYTPEQNGKQEAFWAGLESRLVAMLEGATDLTLAKLNEATIAWIEMGYNRAPHSSIGCTPLERFLKDKDVGRRSPPIDELRLAFTRSLVRTQRHSDGTIRIEGVRFEVPSRYGHMDEVHVRCASWDLSRAYLCDPTTGAALATIRPQDTRRNAEGARGERQRPGGAPATSTPADHEPTGVAPLLEKLMADYASTGLPPAYLPTDDLGNDGSGSRVRPDEPEGTV